MLVAPPGAGKTTRVPLALLDAPWAKGKKIIVLEPRRIAARASAERMAQTLGERVGDTVGYRVRFGSKMSRATRIEVVTEGIFSRRFDDPELSGVAAVLFDEFHERSLDADLGLALARDAQTGLREDLRILVMSATLDGARVAKLARRGAGHRKRGPHLSGRDPLSRPQGRCAAGAADGGRDRDGAARRLPARCWRFCRAPRKFAAPRIFGERVHDASVEIVPLFGALDAAVQDRAIAPAAEGAPQGGAGDLDRRDVADHRRRAHCRRFRHGAGAAYEPDIGLTRLETVRASRAAVDQRRGRASRTEPGVCYRLWDEPQTASLSAYTQPRFSAPTVVAGARPRAMESRDAAPLAFLDLPPAPALEEARGLLRDLGALDGDGRITAEGKSLRGRSHAPADGADDVDSHRLGAGRKPLTSPPCFTERGLGGDGVDLDFRLDQFRRDRSQRAGGARSQAQRWAAQWRPVRSLGHV